VPSTTLALTRAQANDARLYRGAKARAERDGLEVVIAPE
jgi:hypothetical protein